MVRPLELKLEGEKIRAIEEFLSKTKSAKEYKRARAVLLVAKGKVSTEVAESVGISQRTVVRCVHRYEERGIEGFKDKPRSGRKPTVTKEAREKLLKAALKSPRLFGFLKNNWSLGMLRLYLRRETGTNISEVHVWRLLRKHGVVYKRPKLVAPGKRGKGAEKVENYKRVAKALLKKG